MIGESETNCIHQTDLPEGLLWFMTLSPTGRRWSKKTTTEASLERDTPALIALKKQKQTSGPRRAAQDVVILEAPGCEYANLPAPNLWAASRGILDRPFPPGGTQIASTRIFKQIRHSPSQR